MKNTMINFKTSPQIAKLIELEAEKRGYKTKSEFLTMAVMDALIGFEAVRHKDTIADILDIFFEPRLHSLINDKDLASDLISLMKKLQSVYCKERLLPLMRRQKHLTDTAVQSYLQGDDIIEQTGVDGFIVHNCLVAIYDRLFAHGIIEQSEWEQHSQHYSMYLEHGGAQLLKQQE
jgi:hypothetical protein